MLKLSKKLSNKEVKKLLLGSDLNTMSEEIKKVQENFNQKEELGDQKEVWIISDSTSNFSALNLKNG